MLTLEPALRRSAGRGCKLGVALAGGGPLGAFYELGALHALSEAIVGRALTTCDVYVGVSSGSLVAAGLANGFDTTELGSMFIRDEATFITFSPGMFLQPAVGGYLQRIRQLPRALSSIARQYVRSPLQSAWPAAVRSLSGLLPTALFDSEPLERYLHTLFRSAGHTDDFRRLPGRLYVVATNLDTAESVAFGDAAHERVPISRAVAASAALPGLYAPVEIGGEHYVDGALIRTMHASLALEAGCDLVLCINPLVPFDASGAPRRRRRLAEEGLDTILSQTFRALIHSRMNVGMASYRARFPRADTILLQPDRNDERLFFTNVFRYAGRHRVADHAYQSTRRDLLAQASELSRVLEAHGLGLNERLLREKGRSFATAASERMQHVRHTAQRLGGALHRLEALFDGEAQAPQARRRGRSIRVGVAR
ncbi:MAG TPA: patatin-like phospholipase family protein [Steroidobacteraceae bacterium]|nr:patatin-like phospholipase family protein [Steroidobacteraceae bacterium]